MRKRNITICVSTAAIAVALLAGGNCAWAEAPDGDFTIDGISYFRENNVDAKGPFCFLRYIHDSAGLNVIVPEEVFGERVAVIDMYPIGGNHGDPDPTIENTTMERLVLPKTIERIINDGEPYNQIFSGCTALKSVSVDPENQYFSDIDGILFRNNDGVKYATLMCCPPEIDLAETFELPTTTSKIGSYAFKGVKSLEYLFVPKTVESVDYSGITNNPALRYLEAEGDTKMRSGACESNPTLREIRLGDGVSLSAYAFTDCPELVKAKLPSDLTGLQALAFNGTRVMFLNLPSAVRLGQESVGAPQAVLLGSSCMLEEDWIDCYANRPLVLCCLSEEPPVINPVSPSVDHKDCKPTITLYVPEKSISKYRADSYWSVHAKEILPISPALIPLVSEPQLNMEEGWTHEYLWDVMPIGGAVSESDGEWSVADPTVASIESDGRLTALKPGRTIVSFTINDQNGVAYTATSDVVVFEQGGVGEIAEPTGSAVLRDGVYNLHGQRISDSTEGLPPGFYIVTKGGKTVKQLLK